MSHTDVFFITGASRGIGEALAVALAARPNAHVFGLQRGALSEAARATPRGSNSRFEHVAMDLSDPDASVAVFEQLLRSLDLSLVRSITLVHNAALIDVIAPIGIGQPGDIARVFNVNTIAPLKLTEVFVAHLRSWTGTKRLLSISSGAAVRPVHSWNTYCSTKAALEMHIRVLSTEQRRVENGVRCVSLQPGVVDTELQSLTRTADPALFPDSQRFHTMHREGKLLTPAKIAEQIVKLLDSPTFGDEPLLTTRIDDAQIVPAASHPPPATATAQAAATK